jgi:aminopeptidase-like protein
VLLSCHVCHPSLCNDNLSSIAIAATLARALSGVSLRYTYRFLFAPGTIGAIAWLAQHQNDVSRIRHGLVLAGLGDASAFTYKRSRRGTTEIDRIAAHVLTSRGEGARIRDFSPYGYDERQFCSPGFNLPVGRLGRAVEGECPEYHTSADDLDYVTPAALAESYDVLLSLLDAVEHNRHYLNKSPMGEPQLGRRGLYGALGATGRAEREMAMLWVLNLSDGDHSLLDIAVRAGLPFAAIRDAAALLERHQLLAPCDAA